MAFSETSSQLTPPSTGESLANLTSGLAGNKASRSTDLLLAIKVLIASTIFVGHRNFAIEQISRACPAMLSTDLSPDHRRPFPLRC